MFSFIDTNINRSYVNYLSLHNEINEELKTIINDIGTLFNVSYKYNEKHKISLYTITTPIIDRNGNNLKLFIYTDKTKYGGDCYHAGYVISDSANIISELIGVKENEFMEYVKTLEGVNVTEYGEVWIPYRCEKSISQLINYCNRIMSKFNLL